MTDSQTKRLVDAIGHEFEVTSITYKEQDAALYALAIGASQDPLEASDLQYTYELFSEGFKCFPTFATRFPTKTMEQIASIPGQQFNLLEVVHGEHYLEIVEPLPPSGTITSRATIDQVYDKGSGAVIITTITSTDEGGRHVATNRASLFLRGRGGFGGKRGPSSNIDSPPKRDPDAVVRDRTATNQALLFRLASGDYNPLHADSRFAALLGFDRPILHGLCTYGFAARAVLKTYGDHDPDLFESIRGRFSHHIYPGETIETEMWQATGKRIQFRCRAVERNKIILTNGVATLA